MADEVRFAVAHAGLDAARSVESLRAEFLALGAHESWITNAVAV
jgi:hypothetical protein